jgi:hypothetical protein
MEVMGICGTSILNMPPGGEHEEIGFLVDSRPPVPGASMPILSALDPKVEVKVKQKVD